ncbi:MAG: hypothetical protein AAF191_07755 [Verrucomicrobiota bacterium]
MRSLPGKEAVPVNEEGRGWERWWIYQRERFPLLGHGPLILAFSTSALTFYALLHEDRFFGTGAHWVLSWVTAFVSCLLFFLQLRIADEFKDAEEDREFRPYRAVPRGLVRLRELGWLFVIGVGIQLALALWLDLRLLLILFPAWAYLALMSHEFFARDWLVARPLTYLWTHMLIMPIVDLYATSCHWLVRGYPFDLGLKWFLVVSFCNGVLIEVGRKLRNPGEEEEGVRTYSKLWGNRRAPLIWMGLLGVTMGFSLLTAAEIDFFVPMLGACVVLLAMSAWLVRRFFRGFPDGSGKPFEAFTGVWTLVLYLFLGPIPYFLRS